VFISKKEFAELFGDYFIWKVKNTNWFFSDHIFIGVYGKSNASRLKNILREHGADFKITEGHELKSKFNPITKDYRRSLNIKIRKRKKRGHALK